MNIIMISTWGRAALRRQALNSLQDNAVDWSNHTLTLVADGYRSIDIASTVISNRTSQGASASRNIGAASIPKYRRHKHVMFIDDDVYMLPGWDQRIEETLDRARCREITAVISGHAHPFNKALFRVELSFGPDLFVDVAPVLSTVHLAMPWSIWDDVGEFIEPGGPGGSEDVHWCARAEKRGYGLAVTHPMCVVHCGLTSTSGKQIVGYDQMMAMNTELVAEYGLQGKVAFQ